MTLTLGSCTEASFCSGHPLKYFIFTLNKLQSVRPLQRVGTSYTYVCTSIFLSLHPCNSLSLGQRDHMTWTKKSWIGYKRLLNLHFLPTPRKEIRHGTILHSCAKSRTAAVAVIAGFFCAFGPKLGSGKNSGFHQNSDIFCRNTKVFETFCRSLRK